MNRKTIGLLSVMAGNIIFGFSFLFSKIALNLTTPTVLIATRFAVAFLLLNLIVFIGKSVRKKDGNPLIDFRLKGKPLKPILTLAICQPVIYFIAEGYGIQLTSSSLAGVLIALIPIAGVIADVCFMHAPVSKKQILCAIASVAGVFFTTLGAPAEQSSLLGIVLLLVAVASGAGFFVLSKKAGKFYNPLERTYVMFAIGSAVYVTLALIENAGNYDRLLTQVYAVPSFWISIAYLAVVSSVIAFLFLNFGSGLVSVSQATIMGSLTTVISILAGVCILKEAFTLPQIIGAVIILISVYAGR